MRLLPRTFQPTLSPLLQRARTLAKVLPTADMGSRVPICSHLYLEIPWNFGGDPSDFFCVPQVRGTWSGSPPSPGFQAHSGAFWLPAFPHPPTQWVLIAQPSLLVAPSNTVSSLARLPRVRDNLLAPPPLQSSLSAEACGPFQRYTFHCVTSLPRSLSVAPPHAPY